VGAAIEDPLKTGRDALERHAWREAYESLVEADREGLLSADGLRMLAEAAWWSGEPDVVLDALERTYGAYLKEEDRSGAAMAAFELARQNAMRMAHPVAGGWFAQAERLAGEIPEAPVHGYLAWMRGFMSGMQGDLDAAAMHNNQALEIATRLNDRNLQTVSLYDKGWLLCSQGKPAEGMAMMDEAMVAVVGGELDPIPTGYIYCGMIASCARLGEYRRAAEWTEATTRWCERNSITGFPGICRVHRAQIMRLRGAWPSAEEEARRACDELPRFNFVYGLGYAFYEIGEVRRRMGDFAGAEEAYGRAHEYGGNPEPGRSLIRLAQGKLDAAAGGVRRALAEEKDPLSRVQALVAQAGIAIAAGDVETAAAAADELESIAELYGAALPTVAAGVRGTVRLAQGDAEGAVPDLRKALRGWQEIDAPYEAAEIRVQLGRAYHAAGDEEAGRMELQAARSTFERLGARWAEGRTNELLNELMPAGETPQRVKRSFMFTDIVKSTDLVGAIGDEAWESLLSWHDQTLRSMFAAHEGEVVHHTGDGFFVTFEDATAALTCAVVVQRALAKHRRTHGFAPFVRIGIHAAEATRRGDDYGGAEVHKAARIAALAEGGEILASEGTVAAANGRFGASESREVTLKGFSDPIHVTKVEWR
jgi:class 3 adenylate cyclase